MSTSSKPSAVQTIALTALGLAALLAVGDWLAAGATLAIVVLAYLLERWLGRKSAGTATPATRAARVVFWLTIAVALAAYSWGAARAGSRIGLLRLAAVLLAACPRTLLGMPDLLARAGLERARARGFSIARPATFARLREARVLVIDKAGLLTANQPRLAQRLEREEGDREHVLELAAALERHADHPLARAMAAAGTGSGSPVQDLELHASAGVTGRVDGRRVVVGSPELLVAEGIDVRPLTEAFHFAVLSGQTAIAVAVDGDARAVYTFTDEVRPGVREALEALKRRGFFLLATTGERTRTLQVKLQSLWVHEVRGHLTSDKKVALLEELEAAAKRPVFLTCTDREVVLRFPHCVLLGAAAPEDPGPAITLPEADLNAVVALVDVARAPSRSVQRAVTWLCLYHAVALPLAGLGLLPPIGAALAGAVASLGTLAWLRRG